MVNTAMKLMRRRGDVAIPLTIREVESDDDDGETLDDEMENEGSYLFELVGLLGLRFLVVVAAFVACKTFCYLECGTCVCFEAGVPEECDADDFTNSFNAMDPVLS
jgi:hypothetical protein